MIFYCKNCAKEFEVNDLDCEGYYNWKCPTCMHIANKNDKILSPAVIWKCDTGTVKKNSGSNNNCANCPNKHN